MKKQEQKKYSRDEKIKYYRRKILNLEFALNRAQTRLHYIMSNDYQDWNSDLQKELKHKKAVKKTA